MWDELGGKQVEGPNEPRDGKGMINKTNLVKDMKVQDMMNNVDVGKGMTNYTSSFTGNTKASDKSRKARDSIKNKHITELIHLMLIPSICSNCTGIICWTSIQPDIHQIMFMKTNLMFGSLMNMDPVVLVWELQLNTKMGMKCLGDILSHIKKCHTIWPRAFPSHFSHFQWCFGHVFESLWGHSSAHEEFRTHRKILPCSSWWTKQR